MLELRQFVLCLMAVYMFLYHKVSFISLTFMSFIFEHNTVMTTYCEHCLTVVEFTRQTEIHNIHSFRYILYVDARRRNNIYYT